jgi:chromosome segregation ATPase
MAPPPVRPASGGRQPASPRRVNPPQGEQAADAIAGVQTVTAASGVTYKILSPEELHQVHARMRALNTLLSTSQSDQFIHRLEYKAEVAKEMESNLARVLKRETTHKQEIAKLKAELEQERKTLAQVRRNSKQDKDRMISTINDLKRQLDENSSQTRGLKRNLEDRNLDITKLKEQMRLADEGHQAEKKKAKTQMTEAQAELIAAGQRIAERDAALALEQSRRLGVERIVKGIGGFMQEHGEFINGEFKIQ